MTTTQNPSPEALAYASRWRTGTEGQTYRANDTRTFIATDAEYHHLYVAGRRVGSFGTLAEAKAAA